MPERWAEADAYEPYVGRWSRLVAAEFLAWLEAPPGLAWLDVGCGSGAVAHAIQARSAPRLVLAADRSFEFLTAARSRSTGATGRFVAADARELPAAHASFDNAVSGLVLNFVPEPGRMIAEMTRAVRRHGWLALYVWDYADRMELMRWFWDVAVELDPSASALDEGRRFPLCRPEPLRALLADQGLTEVAVQAIDVPTVFRDFDDYWRPFLGGQGPAPGYVSSLGAADRARLCDVISGRLPRAADGSIALMARAWAVRGRVARD
jgi:SAM-dependent methyltransferase